MGNSWSPSYQQEEEVEQERSSDASMLPRNEQVETYTEDGYKQPDRRTDKSLTMERQLLAQATAFRQRCRGKGGDAAFVSSRPDARNVHCCPK